MEYNWSSLYRYIAHIFRQYGAGTNDYIEAKTSYGQVRGHKRHNVNSEYGQYYSFEGIPYAKPPLGELRLRAPQPPEPWQGVLECTKSKSKPKWVEGSEDCLHLKVYVKKVS